MHLYLRLLFSNWNALEIVRFYPFRLIRVVHVLKTKYYSDFFLLQETLDQVPDDVEYMVVTVHQNLHKVGVLSTVAERDLTRISPSSSHKKSFRSCTE